jgi:hypothetical protein
MGAEGVTKPLDLIPSALQPGGHDQHLVANHRFEIGPNQVVLWIKGGCCSLDPPTSRWDQPRFISACLGNPEHTPTDQSPSRLVVVISRRLENGHIKLRSLPQQDVSQGDAGRPASHNQDTMVL